ncbi:MAG: toll/interleukin-1 receptor domain-containing protein [Candidatus Lokiarchaeota archaeon]|nr:toll/interleukin-1 receptor domain-containing protein [Candidatus Harpocratesius repetitus]
MNVFISYSSRDRTFAERIANRLKKNGINTWFDHWALYTGDSINDKIETGLANANALLIVFSENSIVTIFIMIIL